MVYSKYTYNRLGKQGTAGANELIMTGKQVNKLNSNKERENGTKYTKNGGNTGPSCNNLTDVQSII